MQTTTAILKGVGRKMVELRAGLGEKLTLTLSITHHRNETKEDRYASQLSSCVTFSCSFTFSQLQFYICKMGTF